MGNVIISIMLHQRMKFAEQKGHDPSPDGINNDGTTDLHFAAELNLDVLIESLLSQGAKADAKDNRGFTPLHFAASNDARKAAEVLLNQEDVEVNVRDNQGSTPLHFAVLRKARATAEVLLNQEDIEVNARDNEYGWTPLYIAEHNNDSTMAELLRRYGGRK